MGCIDRLIALLLLAAAGLSAQPGIHHHVVIYKEAGRYGGWPADYGLWIWGNEILIGFSSAAFHLETPDREQYDPDKPQEPRLARSMNGGETWSVEAPPSLRFPEQGGNAATDLAKPMDFSAPGFALQLRRSDAEKSSSLFWFTTDKGKNWQGPFNFPLLDQPGIIARTDYIINSKQDLFAFLTSAKSDGSQGRALCARTENGGLNWQFVSWVGGEPAGYSIAPSTVRVTKKELISATRVKYDEETTAIEVYRSTDDGTSWKMIGRPATFTGAFDRDPPCLIRLRDGRLCLTYAVRTPPYRICARFSNDGKTWSDEFVLRNDAASWDIGYLRSVQRPDGNIVSTYYFAEQPHTERIIAGTIWDPGAK